MTKFPMTLAAVQKRDRSLWDIGDALLEECGPPSETGGDNDGSHAKLLAVAAEIEGLKIGGYSLRYLMKLRSVSNTFAMARRVTAVSWDAHQAAGTPEMLTAIIKAAPPPAKRGQPKVSRDYVREMRDELERREREEAEAVAAAESAGRSPPPKLPAIEVAKQAATQVAINQSTHKIMALLARTHGALDEVSELAEANLLLLSEDSVDAIVEQLLAASNKARDQAAAVGRAQRKKRGHLALVNE